MSHLGKKLKNQWGMDTILGFLKIIAILLTMKMALIL